MCSLKILDFLSWTRNNGLVWLTKKKIKQLKTNVDVLTLTATPIPRTLHMSLIGIRDMSVLEEPPMDRVPIQTYVMEYNEELVRGGNHAGTCPWRTGILCV